MFLPTTTDWHLQSSPLNFYFIYDMGKTAIILGATGAVGSQLLERLLQDPEYSKIKLFARGENTHTAAKIDYHKIDVLELDHYATAFTGDVVFCCIGTTKAKTPDTTQYRKIDFGIPVTAARLSKENGIPVFIVISALGANSKSSTFYTKTKGEMQDAVLELALPKTHILQPSLIVSKRADNRILEKIATGFMALLNPLLVGSARKYRSITAEKIAITMQWLATHDYATFVPSDKIQEIAHRTIM